MAWIGTFLNFAGSFIYTVMIGLAVVLWQKFDGQLISAASSVLANPESTLVTELNGFIVIVRMTMAYFAAVNDIANLVSARMNFHRSGLITSLFALFIGGFWVSFINEVGMGGFVNTLGATLAPLYGIMIVDYYLIRNKRSSKNLWVVLGTGRSLMA